MSLTEWRKSRGISQIELCKFLGVTQGMLSKIENGLTPSFEIAKRISKVTDIEIGELFPKYKI